MSIPGYFRSSARAATVFILVLAASDSFAAPTKCAQREEILSWLARAYGERPVATGVTSGDALMELARTRDGATWTLLVTSASGRTCVLAAGEGWRTQASPTWDPAT